MLMGNTADDYNAQLFLTGVRLALVLGHTVTLPALEMCAAKTAKTYRMPPLETALPTDSSFASASSRNVRGPLIYIRYFTMI